METQDNHDPELDELVEDDSIGGEDADGEEGLQQEKRRVFTDKSDPPIGALHMRHKSGDLVLEPLFQRRKVWDDIRSSRLIESLILEVPLPVFYLAEGRDGADEVIDGQQRLSAFFRFLDNDYALRGLKASPALNGKRFRDLDKSIQKLIRDSSIRTIIFKKESDENLRFEIFQRLNTGAVPLNQQELRNCVYRGSYNALLIELSADPDYTFLMGLRGPDPSGRACPSPPRIGIDARSRRLEIRAVTPECLSEKRAAVRAETRRSRPLVALLRLIFLPPVAISAYFRGNPFPKNKFLDHVARRQLRRIPQLNALLDGRVRVDLPERHLEDLQRRVIRLLDLSDRESPLRVDLSCPLRHHAHLLSAAGCGPNKQNGRRVFRATARIGLAVPGASLFETRGLPTHSFGSTLKHTLTGTFLQDPRRQVCTFGARRSLRRVMPWFTRVEFGYLRPISYFTFFLATR